MQKVLGTAQIRIFAVESWKNGYIRNFSSHALRFAMGSVVIVNLCDH